MKAKDTPLRAYRKANKLSLKELARCAQVDRITWFRWERVKVPAEKVAMVEASTGIPRHVLRPDLFGATPHPTQEATV